MEEKITYIRPESLGLGSDSQYEEIQEDTPPSNPNIHLICCVGRMQAGKTTAIQYIKDNWFTDSDVWVQEPIKFAEPHYAVLDILGVKKHRAFMQQFSDLAKEHFGQSIFCEMVEEKLRELLYNLSDSNNSDIVYCIHFDDVRYVEEWNVLSSLSKELGAKLHTIAIEATDDVRKSRNPTNYQNNSHNSEIQYDSLRNLADYIVENNNIPDNLFRQLDAIERRIITQTEEDITAPESYTSYVPTGLLESLDYSLYIKVLPANLRKNCAPLQLEFVKLPHCFDLPKAMTPGSAGMDVYSASDIIIPPNGKEKIPTGWKVAVPPGFEMIMTDRSSMFIKNHIATSGTIDFDYRGEVFVMLHNHNPTNYTVARGDRIAQAKIREVIAVDIVEVDELDETERGEGGFGHTGK